MKRVARVNPKDSASHEAPGILSPEHPMVALDPASCPMGTTPDHDPP